MVDAPAKTPSAEIMPFAAREATLVNGLRVIVVPTGFPNLVSLQIPVQTGSRNEVEPGKSGFAHFFEHMAFRGTARFPAAAYQAIVTRSGARQNAYTTDDYTNYHITFAAEDLETILEIEADRVINLAYSEEDFKTEARAVLGEYNKSSSEPVNKLLEVQRDSAYTVHPYKHTTMGFLHDIEAMPNQFEYSRTFFDRWYRPEFTTLIVAGDLEPDRVIGLIEKHWGGWRPGSHTVEIPREPAPEGPVVAHVPWDSPTLPWVTAGFHGPAFSETAPDFAALDLLFDLFFGPTSDLYRRLVETEQTVDRLFPYVPANADPALATVLARLKRAEDAPAARDAILATVARARRAPVAERRLAEAKANARYHFARTLDNSEAIASTLARFVRFRRSYDTVNALFRVYDSLTPADLQAAAERYLRDERMVITTLSHGPLPEGATGPASIPVAAEATGPGAEEIPFVLRRSPAPLLRFKLLFNAGSADDPAGREGLAALAAEMIADAGSAELRIDEIKKALFPMAGTFTAQVDREMTTFTGVIHQDNLDRFAEIVLPQLLAPGMREADFTRLQQRRLNALLQDLRANNDEELGKERLQATIFTGTHYGHPVQGTVAGLEAVTLDDVRAFVRQRYTRAALTVGVTGDVPEEFITRLRQELSGLPSGEPAPPRTIVGRRPQGIEIEIVQKETRATALSFGHPIEVTRAHPDFAALWLARAWLGEHRASQGQLFVRLREQRGLNYGDYAYIEALPGGMYRMMPNPNVARRAQIFEVWVRPVPPGSAVFAFKAALQTLREMIERGISEEDFEITRDYLMKNVYVMTETQDQQLGYTLDSRWYGAGEFTEQMRERLQGLSSADVNAAVRRHLSGTDLHAVFVTKDAEGLRRALLSGEPATITYDAQKPPEILAEDREIGALPLHIDGGAITITPVESVFAE